MSFMRCQFCGDTDVKLIHLRRSVGLILARQWYSFDGYLCREHARKEALRWLGLTLVFGWWGVISFFANITAVICDLGALAGYGERPNEASHGSSTHGFGDG
jgi:hypothetical protein